MRPQPRPVARPNAISNATVRTTHRTPVAIAPETVEVRVHLRHPQASAKMMMEPVRTEIWRTRNCTSGPNSSCRRAPCALSAATISSQTSRARTRAERLKPGIDTLAVMEAAATPIAGPISQQNPTEHRPFAGGHPCARSRRLRGWRVAAFSTRTGALSDARQAPTHRRRGEIGHLRISHRIGRGHLPLKRHAANRAAPGASRRICGCMGQTQVELVVIRPSLPEDSGPALIVL
jgi:hypothetical protein